MAPFLLILALSCGWLQQSAGAPAEWTVYDMGYKPEAGRTYRSLPIPKPVSRKEWNSFAEMLAFSPEQLRIANDVYDRYRMADWKYRTE